MVETVDDEWAKYLDDDNTCSDDDNDVEETNSTEETQTSFITKDTPIPEPTDIYISTKSKIVILNEVIEMNMFWDIPVIPYYLPMEGVVKKEIKINSKTPEEVEEVEKLIAAQPGCKIDMLKKIDSNLNNRAKFRDIRKITVGICKKDIDSVRKKKKQAFHNCIVVILRLKIEDKFKEFHVKIFKNKKEKGIGSIEIPGVKDDDIYDAVLNKTIETIQPFVKKQLICQPNKNTVLINSNFNCGFYLDRYVLCEILRSKYNIEVIYDECSYPGLQCQFCYNPHITEQTGKQISISEKEIYPNASNISFMVFRTGSVLIVGKCDDAILNIIYNFLVKLFKEEFYKIAIKIIPMKDRIKEKKKTIRTKMITIVNEILKPSKSIYDMYTFEEEEEEENFGVSIAC
jgi:hypothetical protein